MTRREKQIEKEKNASISVGFGGGFGLQAGLLVGNDEGGIQSDQGSCGLVIPFGGCKHIKILVGSD